MHFADELICACREKKSLLCVGLDPDPEQFPPFFKGSSYRGMVEAVSTFNQLVIESVAPYAVAVKPQLAYFEALGPKGLILLKETVKEARRKGLLVILDGKRNDIGSTARAYAKAYLGKVQDFQGRGEELYDSQALTINPYFGTDGLLPFFHEAKHWGKGLFVLVKTSNPSSREIQDLQLLKGGTLALYLAEKVALWGEDSIGTEGYSLIGAVVGATAGPILQQLRQLMPKTPFLVPGIGTQGGEMKDLEVLLDEEGLGILVNVSRDILYHYKGARLEDMKGSIGERASFYRRGLWKN